MSLVENGSNMEDPEALAEHFAKFILALLKNHDFYPEQRTVFPTIFLDLVNV